MVYNFKSNEVACFVPLLCSNLGVLFKVFAEKKPYRLIIYHWTSKILPVISKRLIVGVGGDRDGETETSLNYLSTCVPIHQSNSYIRYRR
jgi:hypothetical protein